VGGAKRGNPIHRFAHTSPNEGEQMSPDEWYYNAPSGVQGPFTSEEMRDRVRSGVVRPETDVCGSDHAWRRADEIGFLRQEMSPGSAMVYAPGSAPGRQRDKECYSCGRLVDEFARYCPHCGAEPDARRVPVRTFGGRFHCPSCGSEEYPITESQIATAGWIVFAVMLVFCWPLFWIGLLIKEDFRRCARCGAKVG
jgi:lipopolysaccharide-induced tumor necrosis factor-alpha factor